MWTNARIFSVRHLQPTWTWPHDLWGPLQRGNHQQKVKVHWTDYSQDPSFQPESENWKARHCHVQPQAEHPRSGEPWHTHPAPGSIPCPGFVLEVTDKFWHSSKFTKKSMNNEGRRCWISTWVLMGVFLKKKRERRVNTLPPSRGFRNGVKMTQYTCIRKNKSQYCSLPPTETRGTEVMTKSLFTSQKRQIFKMQDL